MSLNDNEDSVSSPFRNILLSRSASSSVSSVTMSNHPPTSPVLTVAQPSSSSQQHQNEIQSSTSTTTKESTFAAVEKASEKKRKHFENDQFTPHEIKGAKFKLIKKPGSQSFAWRFFHIYAPSSEQKYPTPDDANEKMRKHACCNLCGNDIVYYNNKTNRSTTGPLITHLQSKHKISQQMSDIKKKALLNNSLQAAFNNSSGLTFKNTEEKNEYILQKTCNWIASDLLPFSTVESESFFQMIKAHNPQSKVVSNKNVKKCVNEMEMEI